MERYGVGGYQSVDNDIAVALVFLSSEKSASCSWLLGIKHLDGTQEEAYANDPHTYKLSPNTSLGVSITALLEDCVFESL